MLGGDFPVLLVKQLLASVSKSCGGSGSCLRELDLTRLDLAQLAILGPEERTAFQEVLQGLLAKAKLERLGLPWWVTELKLPFRAQNPGALKELYLLASPQQALSGHQE